MQRLRPLALAGLLIAAACARPADPPPAPQLAREATSPLPSALTPEAQATVDELRRLAEDGSPRRLARYADTFPGFQSNFGGADHYDHWYMRRRMGSDPSKALLRVLEEPYAVRQIGDDDVWFIWPDLAVIPVEQFAPERQNYRDRARLEALIGEAGLAAMERGEPYPGYRLAISASGRWIYFVDGN